MSPRTASRPPAPSCEEEIYFDESVLEDGEIICPNCGDKLEFDLSDLANAVEDGEDRGVILPFCKSLSGAANRAARGSRKN